jgi:pimeloyl-ACP methyl ester carboxylesterase
MQELRLHVPRAHDIAGAGHNAHIEEPAAVGALLEQLLAGA